MSLPPYPICVVRLGFPRFGGIRLGWLCRSGVGFLWVLPVLRADKWWCYPHRRNMRIFILCFGVTVGIQWRTPGARSRSDTGPSNVGPSDQSVAGSCVCVPFLVCVSRVRCVGPGWPIPRVLGVPGHVLASRAVSRDGESSLCGRLCYHGFWPGWTRWVATGLCRGSCRVGRVVRFLAVHPVGRPWVVRGVFLSLRAWCRVSAAVRSGRSCWVGAVLCDRRVG